MGQLNSELQRLKMIKLGSIRKQQEYMSIFEIYRQSSILSLRLNQDIANKLKYFIISRTANSNILLDQTRNTNIYGKLEYVYVYVHKITYDNQRTMKK